MSETQVSEYKFAQCKNAARNTASTREIITCCPNCKETNSECACIRNKCIRCGDPVGNITFTVCDDCWDKKHSQSFADLFRESRIEKEITLRELSKAVGLSIGYLSDIEHKRRNPPAPEIVVKIENALEIDDSRLQVAAAEAFSRTSRGKLETENRSLRESLQSLVTWYRRGNPNDREMEKRIEAAEGILGEKG
jgi:transcriptional regulator with XRE-family HTH domain